MDDCVTSLLGQIVNFFAKLFLLRLHPSLSLHLLVLAVTAASERGKALTSAFVEDREIMIDTLYQQQHLTKQPLLIFLPLLVLTGCTGNGRPAGHGDGERGLVYEGSQEQDLAV